MRYFFVDGTYTPKHCIYGPRQREGVLLDDWEWYGINDDLRRWKREREMAEECATKERSKRDMSHNITKNWQNTLASIKTQSEQRRIEKREKDKQDKIDKYNEILESRKKEKKVVLAKARRVIFEGKDTIRTLGTALERCAVITEREKQIEFKNMLKEEKAKEEEALVERMKKDLEDYRRELKEEEERKMEERKAYRECLTKQVEEKRQRFEETEGRKRKAEEEDVRKMAEVMEKMKKCEEQEKRDYVRRMRMSYEKSYFATELEKSLAAEEEEENEVNRMINKHAKIFAKERAAKEAALIAESIANREKRTEMLAKSMAAKRKKDEGINEKGVREREEEELKRAKEEEEERRKAKANMAAWEAEHKAKVAEETRAKKEALKWTILQNERRQDVDKAWAAERRKRVREMKMKTREGYAMQIKENKELEEETRKHDSVLTGDDDRDASELLKYCSDAVEYAKERGWKDFPILDAVAELKKELSPPPAAGKQEKHEASQQGRQKSGRPTGLFCYCFKN